jgi:hypothetical protein
VPGYARGIEGGVVAWVKTERGRRKTLTLSLSQREREED